MKKEHYKLLFSLSIKMTENNPVQPNKTNDHVFSNLYSIAEKTINALCNTILIDVYNTRRSKDNISIDFEHNAINENIILLNIYFSKPNSLDNTEQVDKIIYDIIVAASEILLIENYLEPPATHYEYQHVHHLNYPLEWCAKRTSPYIHVKYKAIFELANKIEPIVNTLYSFNQDTEITITINNKTTAFLPVKKMKSRHHIHLSRKEEIYNGHVVSGKVKNNQNTFLFKEEGKNSTLHIVCDDLNYQKKLSRLAKYRDPVTLSAKREYRFRRGNKEIINRLYLDQILNDDIPGQVPLFQ